MKFLYLYFFSLFFIFNANASTNFEKISNDFELIYNSWNYGEFNKYEDIFTKPFSEIVGRANNYFIKLNKPSKSNLKLIEIYQKHYHWINDEKQILKNLLEINYFKKFIQTFIKLIIYKNILKNNKVWENSDKITNIIHEFQREEERFNKIKLSKEFELFFNNITKIIKKDII